MSEKQNWIQINIRDRGIAFEKFLNERRMLILELQIINAKMKKKTIGKEKANSTRFGKQFNK